MKIVVYSHTHCNGCKTAKAALAEAGITYLEQNLAESIGALRSFMKLRETRPEFAEMREKGRVGLPCILLEDNRILFSLPENLDELR